MSTIVNDKKVVLNDSSELINALPTTKILVLNASNNEVEFIPLSTVQANIVLPVLYIEIGSYIFKVIKGYTTGVKNTGQSLEINDIIGDEIILNTGSEILIKEAIYTGGSSTDFGTYNSTTKEFTGGSYNFIQYKEL